MKKKVYNQNYLPMYLYQKSLVFMLFLMCCSGTLWAQEVKKEPIAEPLRQVEEKPTQKETSEYKDSQPRRAVAQSGEMQAKQKAEQLLEEKADMAVKLKKETEANEQEKAQMLEKDKPSNDEWRTRIATENAKYESRVVAETVAESESRPIASKTNWQQLISQTEAELQQTTDSGLRLKLQNKLNGLRKKAEEMPSMSNIK